MIFLLNSVSISSGECQQKCDDAKKYIENEQSEQCTEKVKSELESLGRQRDKAQQIAVQQAVDEEQTKCQRKLQDAYNKRELKTKQEQNKLQDFDQQKGNRQVANLENRTQKNEVQAGNVREVSDKQFRENATEQEKKQNEQNPERQERPESPNQDQQVPQPQEPQRELEPGQLMPQRERPPAQQLQLENTVQERQLQPQQIESKDLEELEHHPEQPEGIFMK